ncbi:TRAP transporter large permease [Glaciecola sp. MH2013]|uniref:TRAP transporter large permease n=1 Tax=Glaciecola sp. MH2013 TaxID=2785524 RepID=UPI0018A073E0|nr:TRAP transporter large permease [Glaciecola sp. MH2013]MBF7073913.1 TRAP transporter large permease [Glaciecola sp. MH2013]
MTIIFLLCLFFLLLFLNVPISFAIGLATFVYMFTAIDFLPAATTVAQRMTNGVNSFALMAIPFFILSGQIMAQGGIAKRLINCAMALLGALPGGLALVNVLSCTFFGAISGSAVAATSAIGSFMVPQMKKAGYSPEFSAAVTATASTTGLLIPPSNILIIYAIASGGVSISALFLAGYIPGLLVALALMIFCVIYAKRKGFKGSERLPLGIVLKQVWQAVPSLALIFIVMGGIISGIFTPTEAGAIAVIYALILAAGVYREVDMEKFGSILTKTVETTAIVLFLIATSSALSWMLSYENIPQELTDTLLTISENPLMILLIINLILLLIGAFMDMTPAVLIFTPIFLPIAATLGIDPLQFGIMMILNLCIGLCTPPVGAILFVSCAVSKTKIEKMVKPMLPLYVGMIAVLVMVTMFPSISTFLPSLLAP